MSNDTLYALITTAEEKDCSGDCEKCENRKPDSEGLAQAEREYANLTRMLREQGWSEAEIASAAPLQALARLIEEERQDIQKNTSRSGSNGCSSHGCDA